MAIPHNILSVEVGKYFSTFFSLKARDNSHSFGSYEEFSKYSIYQYKPTFTKTGEIEYLFKENV